MYTELLLDITTLYSRFPFPFDVLLSSSELAVVCCHWRRVVLDPRVALRTEVNIELVSSLALSPTVIVVSVLIITCSDSSHINCFHYC